MIEQSKIVLPLPLILRSAASDHWFRRASRPRSRCPVAVRDRFSRSAARTTASGSRGRRGTGLGRPEAAAPMPIRGTRLGRLPEGESPSSEAAIHVPSPSVRRPSSLPALPCPRSLARNPLPAAGETADRPLRVGQPLSPARARRVGRVAWIGMDRDGSGWLRRAPPRRTGRSARKAIRRMARSLPATHHPNR